MPAQSPGPAASRFEIKSAHLSALALLLKSDALDAIAQDLLAHYGPTGTQAGFFYFDAIVLDLAGLDPDGPCPDLKPLIRALRECRLQAVALRHVPPAWQAKLDRLSLAQADADLPRAKPEPSPVEAPVTQAERVEVVREVVREVIREVPGPATMVVDRPLRSGQKVYARGADLIVLAMVNAGAEVVADGHIHVYAPLRGKAMAGARGNTAARIFALSLEPELVSIAGVYRTSENGWPKEVAGRAAQVRLSTEGEQERLIFEPLTT